MSGRGPRRSGPAVTPGRHLSRRSTSAAGRSVSSHRPFSRCTTTHRPSSLAPANTDAPPRWRRCATAAARPTAGSPGLAQPSLHQQPYDGSSRTTRAPTARGVAHGPLAGRIAPRGRLRGPVDDALAALGPDRLVGGVGIYPSSLFLLRDTELIGLSARWGRPLADSLGLLTFAIPLPLRAVPIGFAWRPRHDADPAAAWLRGRAREAIRQDPAADQTVPAPSRPLSRPAFVTFSYTLSVTRSTFGHRLRMRGRRLGRRPRSPSVTCV
ncbi:hypothetical protein AB0F03_11395 [Streptomyces sp. NPDC028722]|uniref:hypothetical protein n=1 Tax=Streptomyces sp. NPDC028722 TaxID=3155016 RepID=UPI003400B9AE